MQQPLESGLNFLSVSTFLYVLAMEEVHKNKEYFVENGIIYEIEKGENTNE